MPQCVGMQVWVRSERMKRSCVKGFCISCGGRALLPPPPLCTHPSSDQVLCPWCLSDQPFSLSPSPQPPSSYSWITPVFAPGPPWLAALPLLPQCCVQESSSSSPCSRPFPELLDQVPGDCTGLCFMLWPLWALVLSSLCSLHAFFHSSPEDLVPETSSTILLPTPPTYIIVQFLLMLHFSCVFPLPRSFPSLPRLMQITLRVSVNLLWAPSPCQHSWPLPSSRLP